MMESYRSISDGKNVYMRLTGIRVNSMHTNLNLSFFCDITGRNLYVVSTSPDESRSIVIEKELNCNDMGKSMYRTFMMADCEAVLRWDMEDASPAILSLDDFRRYLSCLVRARGCSYRQATMSLFHMTPEVLGCYNLPPLDSQDSPVSQGSSYPYVLECYNFDN